MNCRTYLLCLALFSVISNGAFAATASRACQTDNVRYVRLTSVATVSDSIVKLENLLINQSDKDLVGVNKNIPLADLRGQAQARLSSVVIQKKLTSQLKDVCVKLLGPDYILVRHKKGDSDYLINSEVLNNAILFLTEEIEKRYVVRNLNIEINDLMSISLEENDEVRFRWESSDSLSNREQIWLDKVLGERVVRSLPLHMNIEGDVEVFRINQPVSRNSQAYNRHITNDYVPISGVPRSRFDLQIETGAWRYRRRFAANEIISPQDLEQVPAVVRGGFVTLHMNSEKLSIKALTVAMHDGNIGDVVRLHSATSEDYIRALVVGKNLAETIN